MMPRQFLSAAKAKIVLPAEYKTVKNAVLCGMGGSALGGRIFKAQNISSVPFSFYNGYAPPAFVGGDTLFIASSYSGTTEEVLSSLSAAELAGAKIIGLAAGGKLLEICRKKKYPFIEFDAALNPSGQPRYGIGYALGGLYNIFNSLNLLKSDFAGILSAVEKNSLPPLAAAKKIAKKLKNLAPIVVAGEFLEGNAHLFVNQLNETCKTFSEWHIIPEMNHHLLEGLKRPATIKKSLIFLFLESSLYSKRVAARFNITKKIVAKNEIKTVSLPVLGKNKPEQVLYAALLGSVISSELAKMYGEDPADIPWVDYFKKELLRRNFS